MNLYVIAIITSGDFEQHRIINLLNHEVKEWLI
jgi:hypothetical protein